MAQHFRCEIENRFDQYTPWGILALEGFLQHMALFFMGILIGFTLGLTGSGGALVAIPLSMTLLDYGLKDATSFSLIAVFLSGTLNSVAQRKSIRWIPVLWILPFSLLGSSLLLPLRSGIPNELILVLISIVSLFGLWTIWSRSSQETNSQESNESKEEGFLWKMSKYGLVGFILGGLTTLTGLGGGVLLVPLCIFLLRLNAKEAVASSLVPISITALYTLVLQIATSQYNIHFENLPPLFVGILSIAFVLQFFTQTSSSVFFQNIQKGFFSLIVILSLSKIIGDLTLWK